MGPGLSEPQRTAVAALAGTRSLRASPRPRAGDDAAQDLVLAPIGFLCEHLEVVYDLEVAAGQLCDQLGLTMVRAGVVANHPRFVTMIRELILERIEPKAARLALGSHGPSPDVCPDGCCSPLPPGEGQGEGIGRSKTGKMLGAMPTLPWV